MKKIFPLIALLAIALVSCQSEPEEVLPEPIPFPANIDIVSSDGININANVYEISEDAPVILLCHQARFNKFEYAGIAERLNELGFNCVAIDQRSGGPVGDKQNWTNVRALDQGKGVDYLDAEKDMAAAIDFVNKKYGKKVILWGSSYSSTLALYLALENKNVSAVISFSPGDYFASVRGALSDNLVNLQKPMFVTSSLEEAPYVKDILACMVKTDKQMQFIPAHEGYHGSRALWKGQPDGIEYWKAIEAFLELLK
jgi:pimeloyl-ACP methyl ester carboxylesterase